MNLWQSAGFGKKPSSVHLNGVEGLGDAVVPAGGKVGDSEEPDALVSLGSSVDDCSVDPDAVVASELKSGVLSVMSFGVVGVPAGSVVVSGVGVSSLSVEEAVVGSEVSEEGVVVGSEVSEELAVVGSEVSEEFAVVGSEDSAVEAVVGSADSVDADSEVSPVSDEDTVVGSEDSVLAAVVEDSSTEESGVVGFEDVSISFIDSSGASLLGLLPPASQLSTWAS